MASHPYSFLSPAPLEKPYLESIRGEGETRTTKQPWLNEVCPLQLLSCISVGQTTCYFDCLRRSRKRKGESSQTRRLARAQGSSFLFFECQSDLALKFAMRWSTALVIMYSESRFKTHFAYKLGRDVSNHVCRITGRGEVNTERIAETYRLLQT